MQWLTASPHRAPYELGTGAGFGGSSAVKIWRETPALPSGRFGGKDQQYRPNEALINNPSTDLDDHDVRDAATTSQQQQKQRQSLLLHRLTHHCHLQRCPTTIYRKLSRLAWRTTRRTDLTTRLHSISFQCRMDHTTNCRVLQFHSKRKDFWQYQQ